MTARLAPAVPMTRMDNADGALFEELLGAVERVARSAGFVLGEEVELFEREFAGYCRAAHAVGVSSGTDALALALRAVGVRPGDEVIVPSNSFIATAEAVTLVGATPRLVDVDPETHLLTVEEVERSLSARTRCVIPVHLYGRTVDLDPIVSLARRAGISVIEDACQAHGAWYDGRRAGTVADCGCFSFYPAKNLGAWGDGGAIVTNNDEIADRVRLFRSHGERPRYHHRVAGATARLDAIQAAVLRVKLRYLDAWNADRRRLAEELSARLAGLPVRLPAPAPADGDHVFHQYVIETAQRDELRDHLAECGISSAIHYPTPIHLSGAYEGLGLREGDLPVCERLSQTVCSLPIFPSMTPLDVEAVADALSSFAPATRNPVAAVR